MYFWRDNKGKEIDLIIENGDSLIPIDIIYSKTQRGDYFTRLDYWNKISGNDSNSGFVIYNGKEDHTRNNGNLMTWRSIIDFDFRE